MNLSPMSKKISELDAFVEFSNRQVENQKGASYQIASFQNENKVYKYDLIVLNSQQGVINNFSIESYLNDDSKVILEGITY